MMKKIILGIVMSIFAGRIFSFGMFEFGYYETYKIISDDYMGRLTARCDFENDRLKNYYDNETCFVVYQDSFITGSDEKEDIKKDNMRFRFVYEIFTKHKSFKYEINKVTFAIDGKNYNLTDCVYDYSPFDKVRKTEFDVVKVRPEYYQSNYFGGWYKVPYPKRDKKYSIIVDLTYEFDGTKKSKTFKYDYEVKKGFSFIDYIGP